MTDEISSLLPNAGTLPGSRTEANPASASHAAGDAQGTQEPDWETFYARLKARQKLDAQAERDRDLDRFARSPECGENDATFDYLDTYCERSFGIRPNRGNYFNTDLGEETALKPFASAERYLNALMLIKRHGYEAIASDRYRAVTKAEAIGDLRALARALDVPTEKAVARSDGAHAFFDPGMSEGFGNAVGERTDEEIEEDVKDALARVKGENFIATMRAVGYDFDDDDKALLQAALAKGDGMPPEYEPHLASVFRESPEKAARLAAMVDRTRKVESAWLLDVVWRPLWTDGIWRAAKSQAAAIADAATPAINFAAFDEIVRGSSDSAKYYWNDDERAEYARLVGLARTRQTRTQERGLAAPMFGVFAPSGTPVDEEEAKRRVDMACARRLAREALPRAEQVRRRREQLLIEDAVGYRQTYEYGYANRAIAGALSSVGYMATSSVGMGAGAALNTLAQFQSIRDDMVRDGLDPDTALGAQLVSAAVWSAIEKAQVSTAFGKPLTGLQRKVMAMRIAGAKGTMGKFAAIGALARAGSKELLVSTLAESVEEGLQGGVEGFTRGALWTGDSRKAFDAALRQAGSDFAESLGSMAVISVSGMGWKAVTANRQAKSYESLADFAAKRRRAVSAVTGKTLSPDEATPKEAQHALNDVKETLRRHGGDITSALDELRERIGLDEKGLREIGDYLDMQAALAEVARQEKDAKTALRLADFAGGQYTVGAPGSRLDAQALYDLVLPGTKVEEVEVPDLRAAPAAPVETPEISAAAQAEVDAAKAEVDAAKVGSARRGAERKLRKARERLEKSEAAAAAAAPKPTRKVQKVTLPTGESYILERDYSSPDVHTSSWAQSVEQAMQEMFADPAIRDGQKQLVDGHDLSLDAFKALPALDKFKVAVTTEQYLAMTRAEREGYCSHWGLKEGGHTRILDGSGRELLGADGVVTIKDGFRSFVHRGGNWELAHEHGHFIAAVAARRMTPGQIATMRRLFGDPTSGNERWNEENANNQFAEWLRGKYDFKVSTRAERRAKMNWFQRALDTVKHVFWLSGERPPVAPVEREMREKALDAAFNALRSGDFSGLDVYAGIDFAEDRAGKDEKDAAPDARRPAAKASGEKAGNPAPEAGKGVPAASRPVSEAPAPKPAAKGAERPPQRPEGGGEPTASADFQAGYDAAVAAMNANPGAFADGQSVRTGGKMTVFTPDYSMKVEAEPMWTPLASLVESTDDREVQMRDRTRAATDEQTYSKTRPGVFQPLALFPGSKSDDGAPIVGGGNRIISGHGRKRMLDILAQEGRFGEYLDAVAAEAKKRGLTPPPDGMENPVLVLRVTGGLDRRADLVRFAELSNRWGGLERSGAEFAESDARKITDALLRLYVPDASGNLLAASNRPFMAAFLKEVGATGLTNADGTPTPEAALRVQRALMTAVFGNDEKVRSMVQSLLERSQELSLASLQNALMRSAGRLLAMKRQKGSFDIVDDVREAAYQYIAWRVAQQKSPKLTLAEHLRQGDFFAAETPPMQQALARLLDAGRFGSTLEKYSDLVAQQAVDAQSTFGFFEAKTPLQLLGEAERALLAEGETPVTPDPASPEAAAPEQTPPAVQAEPAPTTEAKPADPVEAAQDEIAPPEPETFVPVPAVRGTATLPGPGAEGVKAHQVNADGRPTTAVRTLPPGAWNLLRAPYDVRRPPKPSAQDRAGRGLGISAPPPATDSQGRYWGKVFPHFQGNKAEMADRTSQAIRRTMTKAERDHYSTVVDYFGGGGCWGLYHALTNFENARQLVVNEFDPDRLEKIRLLHEIDGQVADEAARIIKEPKTYARIRQLVGGTSSPQTIASRVQSYLLEGKDEADAAGSMFVFGDEIRKVTDLRERAVLKAFVDCAQTMFATVKDEDDRSVKDPMSGIDKALDALREDGRKAKEAADAFKARGGSISYRSGDAAAFDDAPSGHQVVAVCDPPYYLTQDYQQNTILGLDNVPDNWSYAATRDLLRQLVDRGDAIVYTDEAWWNKESYTPDPREHNGVSTFGKEQQTLLDIINTLDHFDVAGRVAGRQETLGVQHGHATDGKPDDGKPEGGAGRADVRDDRADDARGGDDGARPSVRRVAGDLEGEGRDARGALPHRGREGRVALAREVIVQDIASSVEEALGASAESGARHSVRANPRLREEVEAALNTDRSKGEVVKGGRRIVFCESPRLFEAIGIPLGTVYTKAHTLRKIAKEHALTAEQIASAPELLERPAAVFDDNGEGYVFLTDATAPDEDGVNAPVMFYVRPDGQGNYVASAYARKEAAESKYVNLVNADKVMYIDKDKVARLPLRGEAQSSLITFSAGDDVKTPEDLSSLSSPSSITHSAPDAQVGEEAYRFARHSVRSVREDRMADYARAVRTDARRYAEAAKRTGELPIPPEMRGNASSSDIRFSVTSVWRHDFPKAVCMTTRAPLTETPAERGRTRSSVRRWNSVGLANVATALFAQQLLAGKEVIAEDADSLLRNIGLGAIPAPELLKKAKELAEENREKVKRLVSDNAPELVDALVQSGLEAQFRDALDGTITGAAEAADPSVGREVQRAIQRHETRELMSAKGFDAAQMMAELPIDLSKGILSTADRVKTPEEIAKLEEARRRRAAAEAEMTDEERLAAVDDPAYVPPSEESLALFKQLYDSAKFALEARQAEERRAANRRKRRREEREAEAAKEKAGTEEGSADAAPSASEGSVPSAQADDDALLPAETVARIAPVFDSPELFAQFLVEWTANHVVERHPNIHSTARMWKNPVAIRELKQTATHILRKLARDCLGSPSLNYARNFVDHQINELESDAETRTYKSVLRKVAYVYDAIHANALRLKRRELVNRLVNGYRAKNPATGKTETVPGIRQLAGVKGRFSAVKEEFQRAIDARTEAWAQQLIPLLTMGEEKLASEIAEMERRLTADPTAEDYEPMDGDARLKMADRLAIAKKYGGLVRKMPGEIADAADEILSNLKGQRQELEARRLERENEDKAARDAIVDAMRAGSATDFRKPQGRLGRYADAMQGNLTLEMQNLVRFCRDPEKRQAALEAIETLQAWISEATGRYRVVLGEAQRELREGLAACYGSAEDGIRHLLKDELDPETAAKIFKSRDKVPTYGQLLQLYASSIQSDYRENAEKHGRTAALPIMEQTLTDADKAFHAFAVEWYKRNRRALSDAVEAVTGLPVTSPDALYCPVRVQTEADGFSADAVAWSPVPAALNRRVHHGLDFNEGVNFLSVLQEQAEIRAQTIGYSAVGIRLRDILAHRETQKAARETVGKRDIKTVLDHVKDVLVQNAARKDESAFFAPLNLARKWIARFALAGNVPSAIKQLASMPVWANAMLGGHEIGLKRTMHYLATVGTDEGRAAIRDLAESDGFKARYTMGWSEETQNILMNPSKSRILRHVEKAYDKGMIVNKAVDAVSCLWMAQGFYRDARAHFLSKGLAPDEAKRMALAMTWSVCESGQQSGRIENMNRLQRKGGAGVAAIFQFKTAYLLQNAYLLQAIKEWRAGTPGAMGRAIRAAFINCVWIPAFVQCVNLAWSALMGDEPPEEDPEKWPKWLKDFGWSMIDGVTAPMFGVSTAAHTAYDAVTGNWSWSQSSGIPAIDSAIRVTGDAVRAAADLFKTVTCLDAEEELTSEKLQKDVWRLLKDIAAPVRHGKRMYDNRWGEDAR